MPSCSTRPGAGWYASTVSTRTHSPIRRSGGGGVEVLPRLLSFVVRAMAIAQLTHLHISISASRVAPGQVPEQCFDSFWMAPWDAGGTLGNSCRLCVIFWRTLLRSRIQLSGRPAIVADMSMKIKTESPRLTVTPGEWYASDLLATTSTGFRQMDDIQKVIGVVKLDYRTVRGFPQIDSAAVGCGAVELRYEYVVRFNSSGGAAGGAGQGVSDTPASGFP